MGTEYNKDPIVSLTRKNFLKEISEMVRNGKFPEALGSMFIQLISQTLYTSAVMVEIVATKELIALAIEQAQGLIKIDQIFYELVVHFPEDIETDRPFFHLSRRWPGRMVMRLIEL